METKGLTYGDVKQWACSLLHQGLERVINSKSKRMRPYWIMVIIRDGYIGPPAFGNSNELLHGVDTGEKPAVKDTKSVDMSGNRVASHRFALLEEWMIPAVPLIGTSLWYVNNKTGQVRCEYILPPDKPMIPGFDVELESETVGKCSIKMPIVYGAN